MQELLIIKVTNFFLENPYKEFYLREISKKLKVSPFAAKKYLDILVKEKILSEERKVNLRYFKLNINNITARYLKILLTLKKITDSGLIEYTKENVPNLSSVVLFGSAARGEDNEDSDIDLVIIGKNNISFSDFERKMKKEINTHIFSWQNWKEQARDNKAFYLDIISHGIPLFGELPIV